MRAFSLNGPLLRPGGSRLWPAQRRWNWQFFASMPGARLELSDAAGNPSLVTTVTDYVQAILQRPNVPLAQQYLSG
ncbi:MAG: hypothetical protein ACTHNZ_19605 [Trinickia sp.]|uniref:hypothetical protein n=1 Tax=Trinickia sp. TaxID=2571163 RepID=UPI003F7F69C4